MGTLTIILRTGAEVDIFIKSIIKKENKFKQKSKNKNKTLIQFKHRAKKTKYRSKKF